MACATGTASLSVATRCRCGSTVITASNRLARKRPTTRWLITSPGLNAMSPPHVREIGCHQRQMLRAKLACALCSEQQLNQLVVGLIERTKEHDATGSDAGSVSFNLAIRKTVTTDAMGGNSGSSAQPSCACLFVVEMKQ